MLVSLIFMVLCRICFVFISFYTNENQIMLNLPPYKIFPTISNQVVSLRSVIESDLEELIEISFYETVRAQTKEDAYEMQLKINNDYETGNSIHWCIIDSITNKIVGTCGFYRGFQNEAGELGCILLPHHRGFGYMTSALLLAVQYGKNAVGLSRIWASTSKENKEAIKLLERLNFICSHESIDGEMKFEFICTT